MDVSSAQSISSFFSSLRLPVDSLINNAAIYKKEWDEKTFEESFKTNALGPMLLMEHLASRTTTGRIVNITTGYAQFSLLTPFYRSAITSANTFQDLKNISFFGAGEAAGGAIPPAYKVAKAVLNRATQIFATEHPTATCRAVCPGWVRTDMGGPKAPRTVEQVCCGEAEAFFVL